MKRSLTLTLLLVSLSLASCGNPPQSASEPATISGTFYNADGPIRGSLLYICPASLTPKIQSAIRERDTARRGGKDPGNREGDLLWVAAMHGQAIADQDPSCEKITTAVDGTFTTAPLPPGDYALLATETNDSQSFKYTAYWLPTLSLGTEPITHDLHQNNATEYRLHTGLN